MNNRNLAYLLILPLLVIAGCSQPQELVSNSYSYSFERDMGEWVADGTDLENQPVEWSVERSQDIASNGKTSVRLYLNNMNDQGKIWIERPFDVLPNHTYQVQVEYDLATADWGDMNLWTIITGVVPKPPKQTGGFVYQGHTGNNAGPEDGFVWVHKSYDSIVRSAQEGNLYVIIGIWGTWETGRTYYIDNVEVVFTNSVEESAPVFQQDNK